MRFSRLLLIFYIAVIMHIPMHMTWYEKNTNFRVVTILELVIEELDRVFIIWCQFEADDVIFDDCREHQTVLPLTFK